MEAIDIDKLEAGPGTDMLVAIHVMGWRQESADGVPYWRIPDKEFPFDTADWAPAYSTDMAAAWQVVEAIDLLSDLSGLTLQHWFQRGWCIYEYHDDLGDDGPLVIANTVPLAICRAALKVSMAIPLAIRPPQPQ